MFGKRDISYFGAVSTVFGYIKDGKYIFTDVDYEFELEGGAVVEFCSMQVGGMCMLDYILMENGFVYVLNSDVINRYINKDTFEKQFNECVLAYEDCIDDGSLVWLKYMDECEDRCQDDLVAHDKIYQEWNKANIAAKKGNLSS